MALGPRTRQEAGAAPSSSLRSWLRLHVTLLDGADLPGRDARRSTRVWLSPLFTRIGGRLLMPYDHNGNEVYAEDVLDPEELGLYYAERRQRPPGRPVQPLDPDAAERGYERGLDEPWEGVA